MKRQRFLAEKAAPLLQAMGVAAPRVRGTSRRFACFADDDTYTMVAGRNEKNWCEEALAYGLHDAGDRRLRLVLHCDFAGSTMHRIPWLAPDRQPEVFTYSSYDTVPERCPAPARDDVLESYSRRLKDDLARDFLSATRPIHLGADGAWVDELVAWVSGLSDVDPAHRQSQRAWQCRGRQVLSIRRRGGALVVTAGVLTRGEFEQFEVSGPMPPDEVERCRDLVRQAINSRLDDDGRHHQADEHWMQAVVRRTPRLVGLEMTSLRELPAWRRRGSIAERRQGAWGRGYIDLLGVDAHGTIQVVETKLGTSNPDPLLVLQLLDYYIFVQAYREPVAQRLDVTTKANIAIRAVVGAPSESGLRLSRFVPSHLAALDDIDWTVQTLTGWFHSPRTLEASPSRPLAIEQVTDLATPQHAPSERTIRGIPSAGIATL